MKNTYLTSPAHTTGLSFVVCSADSVEIIRTSWNGGLSITSTERWLPTAEAALYRARLIRNGWRETHGDGCR